MKGGDIWKVPGLEATTPSFHSETTFIRAKGALTVGRPHPHFAGEETSLKKATHLPKVTKPVRG